MSARSSDRHAIHRHAISKAGSMLAGLDQEAGPAAPSRRPLVFRLSTPAPDENGQPLQQDQREPGLDLPVLDMLPYAAILAVISASTAMVVGLITVPQAVVVVAVAAAVTVASLSMMESTA